jgi:archaellum component FlaC
LGLAFFACIMSVRNATIAVARKQEVSQLQKHIEDMPGGKHQFTEEMQRIQGSLEHIADELRALREAGVGKQTPGLEEKMKKLERQIEDLQEKVGVKEGE